MFSYKKTRFTDLMFDKGVVNINNVMNFKINVVQTWMKLIATCTSEILCWKCKNIFFLQRSIFVCKKIRPRGQPQTAF